MTPQAILAAIRAAGGAVYVDGTNLRIVPKACLTDTLRTETLRHRAAVMATLLTELSERWAVTASGRARLVATVPAVTLARMIATHHGADARPLTEDQWAAFDVDDPGASAVKNGSGNHHLERST
jgi:hypothetical protein